MLVSILIPVYNSSKYLARCLNSVINQTYKSIEIIIIDDCSKDSSYEIANDFKKKDSRIQIYKNQKNLLPGYSRNKALNLASGELVWFVDSDDLIRRNAVELIVEKSEDSESASVILIGYVEFIEEEGVHEINRLPGSLSNIQDYFINFIKLTNGFLSMPFLYVFSRNFINENEIRFPENTYYEDIIFIAKSLFYSKNVVVIREGLYLYNKSNESSITQSYSSKKILDLLDIYNQLYLFILKKGVIEVYKDAFMIRFLIFGIGRVLFTYSKLPLAERLNKDLVSKLVALQKFDLLSNESLNLISKIPHTLDDEDLVKAWYIKNISFILNNSDIIFTEMHSILDGS